MLVRENRVYGSGLLYKSRLRALGRTRTALEREVAAVRQKRLQAESKQMEKEKARERKASATRREGLLAEMSRLGAENARLLTVIEERERRHKDLANAIGPNLAAVAAAMKLPPRALSKPTRRAEKVG